MLQKKLNKFVFKHPFLLQLAKGFLSNRLIANNSIYKYLVMKKANHYAEMNREFKDTVFIETTLNCNSRCIFCGHHRKLMIGTMAMELFKKIIADCQEYGINNAILSVYGDPLLAKYFFERVGYLKKNVISSGFVTNALLLTPCKIDKIFEMGGLPP